jgi:hypothetical protein
LRGGDDDDSGGDNQGQAAAEPTFAPGIEVTLWIVNNGPHGRVRRSVEFNKR